MPPPAIEITSGGNMIQYQGFRRRRIVAIPEAMATASEHQRPRHASANGTIGRRVIDAKPAAIALVSAATD